VLCDNRTTKLTGQFRSRAIHSRVILRPVLPSHSIVRKFPPILRGSLHLRIPRAISRAPRASTAWPRSLPLAVSRNENGGSRIARVRPSLRVSLANRDAATRSGRTTRRRGFGIGDAISSVRASAGRCAAFRSEVAACSATACAPCVYTLRSRAWISPHSHGNSHPSSRACARERRRSRAD